MKNLQRYKQLFNHALTVLMLLPVLAWSHGAVDIPVSRQVHCYTLPNFWVGTNDPGCKASHDLSGTYPGQQWNEVAKLVKDYENQSAVENAVPDGQLCAAGDPLKKGLNLPQASWYKTTVIPKGGTIDVRLIGTAPHVPSFVKIYLSKPGYNAATTALKWSDLALVHEERMTVAKTDWGNNPPAISGVSGYFEFKVKVPSGQSGDAVLFTRWQREDPAGEGFYNCSDITLAAAGIPELHDLGQFITPDIPQVLKPGDSVHFRILTTTSAAKELVDITHKITESNLDANVWGREIAGQVDVSIARIGKKQGAEVVFDPSNASLNSVYATHDGYTKAMSIIAGEDPGPVNPAAPVARITGPTTLKSGQAFTFSGTGSSGSNGPLLHQWAVPGMAGAQNGATVSGKALTVTEATPFIARLNVRDQKNGKTSQVEFAFTVTPASGGEEYPAYKEGTAYKDGDIVTNNGKNYKCKPHPYTAWCAGSAWAYAPGSGTAWRQAWDEVQ